MKPNILILDTETTGIDTATAGVCQLAALICEPVGDWDLNIVPLFQTYCKPSAEMTPEAEKVHGIGPDQYWLMPTDEIAVAVLEFMARQELGGPEGLVLAGYNSNGYDLPVISRLCGGALPGEHKTIDIMWMAMRRDDGKSYKLVDVFEQEVEDSDFKKTILTKAHDAMADCWMTAMCLVQFCKQMRTNDANVIADWLARPMPLHVMPHGKHKGKPFNQVPTSYLTWAAGEWDRMTPDLRCSFEQLGYLKAGE